MDPHRPPVASGSPLPEIGWDGDVLPRLVADLGWPATSDIVRAVLTAMDGRLAESRSADPDAARRAVHTLKSAFALVGARDAAVLAAGVEQGTRTTEDLNRAAEAVAAVLVGWLEAAQAGGSNR